MKFKDGKLPHDYEDRLRYLCKLQETFRLYHNRKGKKFRDGKITEKEFRDFQNGWYNSCNLLICKETNKCQSKMSDFVANSKKPLHEQIDVFGPYDLSKYDESIIVNISDIEEENNGN